MLHLVATLNDRSHRALEKISHVETFCRHAGLTAGLRRRIRKHLEYVLLDRKIEFDWKSLLLELSDPLRAEVALQNLRKFFLNPTFMGKEP